MLNIKNKKIMFKKLLVLLVKIMQTFIFGSWLMAHCVCVVVAHTDYNFLYVALNLEKKVGGGFCALTRSPPSFSRGPRAPRSRFFARPPRCSVAPSCANAQNRGLN